MDLPWVIKPIRNIIFNGSFNLGPVFIFESILFHFQSALRRLMEKETRTTRFCLICNYVSRIIDPITSRCAKFRFKPLSSEILMRQLQNICDSENIMYKDEVSLDLTFVFGGFENYLTKYMRVNITGGGCIHLCIINYMNNNCHINVKVYRNCALPVVICVIYVFRD